MGARLFADHSTGVGEQRTIALPDGSSVALNADSALSVNFGGVERRLSLLEGEALFTVMPDPARPFVVEAGGGQTHALGTVFDIDIRPSDVVVTVVEGVVSVAADFSPSETVRVVADQRVRYNARVIPSVTEAIDASAETAWRRGRLIFNRQALGDVVSSLERYRTGSILVMSDELRALPVTGVFDLSDPEAILRTIEETLPVRVTRLPFVTIIR